MAAVQLNNAEIISPTQLRKYKVKKHHLSLPLKYEVTKLIGCGAYGTVVGARDRRNKEPVAIKFIENAFADAVDAKRILREVKLLRHFDHPNVLFLHEVLPPVSLSQFKHIYIVSELMETDLHRIIYSSQPLTPEHIKYFIYQTLSALRYVHSAGVIHRDLKPQNLLVNGDCELKICDFGLARSTVGNFMTEYVVTRWYRAPEILLGCNYDEKVDVWSVGCILAELVLRKPLFPANDSLEMIRMVMHLVGGERPDTSFVTDDRAKEFVRKFEKKSNPNSCKTLAQRFTELGLDSVALDLLVQMLELNPSSRISVHDALRHPFLQEYFCEEDHEEVCLPFDFEEDDSPLKISETKELMFREIAHFNQTAKQIVLDAHKQAALFFPLKPNEF